MRIYFSRDEYGTNKISQSDCTCVQTYIIKFVVFTMFGKAAKVQW